MIRALSFLLLAGLSAGCFASESPGPDDPIDPIVAPLAIDECLATAFAWTDAPRLPDESDRIMVFANYPLVSPDYLLEYYGIEIWIAKDDVFEERFGVTEWGGEGLASVVFGRTTGEETWRVLVDPDAECPPLPDGEDWPTDF